MRYFREIGQSLQLWRPLAEPFAAPLFALRCRGRVQRRAGGSRAQQCIEAAAQVQCECAEAAAELLLSLPAKTHGLSGVRLVAKSPDVESSGGGSKRGQMCS